MSLLGRLEDLSLTDIVQIVFLSRRTGVLEIIDSAGRHTVLFRHGLIVNASAPEQPDLASHLVAAGLIPADSARVIRQMEDSGISCGTAVVEMNLMSKDDLSGAIRERILTVVTPLLQSREGEFNFILSDSISSIDMEYDPDVLFKEGGFSPQKIIGVGEGEKIKPLRGLEESLKAGKALLRGANVAEAPPPTLDLGLGAEARAETRSDSSLSQESAGSEAEAASPSTNVLPFPAREEPFPDAGGHVARSAPAQPTAGQFKVAGGLFEVESPDATYRNVILLERNPLVRVAAKRAFTKNHIKIFQFGAVDDVRGAVADLFRSNSFFVTFLELGKDDSSIRFMQQLKRRNPRLPVVMIDEEADLRRRHDLLRAGADLYLTRPAPARLQPGFAEEELALFADELVLFAERSFTQWEQMTGGAGADAGKRFYAIADQENLDRTFVLLKQLINELSDPNDIGEVSTTILRLSAEYLERGALFVAGEGEFVGLGGFGATGDDEPMDARIRSLRIARNEPSVLQDVVTGREVHHGKMRRTAANVRLIEAMGNLLPTEVIALPILHADRPVGILYGDNAEHRAPIDRMTGLEIFLSQAGYAFGNAVLASRRGGRGKD